MIFKLVSDWFFEKNQKMHFPPENGLIEKLIVPSERDQELSNEWSCR
jgi:hypothetical protein